MMKRQADVPLTRDLVLVGGGHAHALVLRAWGMDPLAGARVTVINPGPTAPYTGMLPGHVAGHYGREELEIDLVHLCRFAGARLILDHAVSVDRETRLVRLREGAPVAYDVASVDVGITARMSIAGFDDHAVGAKPLDVFAARWRGYLARVVAGKAGPQVAVIGGGVAGCELAMAMAHALGAAGVVPEVCVIERGPEITGMSARGRARMQRAMAQMGVTLRVNAQVTQIMADRVEIAGQATLDAAFCVGAAGAFPHDWVRQSDLPLQDGFIKVGKDLGVLGEDALFAVGDCAHMTHAPRPKAGVFAVRAAPVLLNNLRAALGAGFRKPFWPQKNYLKLISLGGKSAMAEKWGLPVQHPALWRWKDHIDQAFMMRLSDLPVPPPFKGVAAAGVREALGGRPLCGGCGAKVSGAVLQGALAAPAVRGDVVTGRGDDAAVLRQPGGGFQVISTDHLRGFVADPIVMTRIAAVHALGDVFAMGAVPQIALSQLVVPRMSQTLQARTLGEIAETAEAVFGAAGAQVVGGHTTMGAELTIGFTVTGTRDTPPIGLAGAQAGDVLVLTRPIGSGVIMAGVMTGETPGAVATQTLAQMQVLPDVEAAALAQAHAMTDVTGFGLAGHLQAMARASGLRARVRWDAVPVYDGALDLVAAGVASSLWAGNVADAPTVGREAPLMHDPQTAGGLLAALPRGAAEQAVTAIQAAGRTAVIIGEMVAGAGPVEVI